MTTQKALSVMTQFPDGLLGLVFDVDGVMFDSRRSNMEFYNLIRRAIQLPPLTREEEDYCHMAAVSQTLERIIPEDRKEAAAEAYSRINYQKQILPLLIPEPGLLETLHWLKLWNVRMAVCTNRTNTVDALLRYFGLESFFAPVKTTENSAPKPSPRGLLEIMREWGVNAQQIAFLGDSKVDLEAARAAGVPFWCFRNESLPAQLHFSNFFKFIKEIAPIVEKRETL